MISCRKHATNDDILLTVAQHSNQTAVLAFTDINMCNRWIYVQQVVWNGITWYWYCVLQADQASKIGDPTKISQILQPKASNESCRMEHDRTASSGFNWLQPYSRPRVRPCPCLTLSCSWQCFVALVKASALRGIAWHSIGRRPSCFDLVSPSASNV